MAAEEEYHDPVQCLIQLQQTLAADKLSVGFFIGAGCPCSIRVNDGGTGTKPLVPNIKQLTAQVQDRIQQITECNKSLAVLLKTFDEDQVTTPTIEHILNRIRAFRDVAGKAGVRGLSFEELRALDRRICEAIREIVTQSLPQEPTPYHALANFIGKHRTPFTEVFTTNYDLLLEQALESKRVPFFDGFIGASRPFFDQRAIEDDKIPYRWSRLWKLHGSINWRFNKSTKTVVRSERDEDGDELLIHPSHLKYDESRRMPYFVMIDRLRSFLRNEQKPEGPRPAALITIGYSFADEHINEAIVESLKANASAVCFALQYGDLAKYAAAVKLAKDNSNLSILASNKAVIRGREARWLASSAVDGAALGGAFKLIEEKKDQGVLQDTEDRPKPCELLLGDFKSFGDFLDGISRNHAAIGERS